MEPSRVTAIQDWPVPGSFREVQVFLGFAYFYRRFILAYSRVAKGITDLLKGGSKGVFMWTDEANNAFRKLKTRPGTSMVGEAHKDAAFG